MTRKSKRELERVVADLDSAVPAPGGSTLTDSERDALRAVHQWRYECGYYDVLPVGDDRIQALVAAALDMRDAATVTVDDVAAAADRLGVERGGRP